MLTNLQLGELCVQIHKHRCGNVFAIAQKAELGTSKSMVNKYLRQINYVEQSILTF